ncbi:MAG: diaminopimelate decarboxylase [Lachnospiraceae bacterium]|nr:diaminopimelate decarboxylase [Lachnospiraceae bacterium]
MFDIKKFRETATPFYFYDMELLSHTLEAIKKSSPEEEYCVHYAIKANSNPVILKLIAENGFGADCVSEGEIRAAINAGFPSNKIVFAGVGKGDSEIDFAIDNRVGCFNVESLAELQLINEMAINKDRVVNIALRVNPNIDAHTHHYITTGLDENKFGIALEMLDEAIIYCMKQPNLRLIGLHFHIGSQITTNEPFKVLCAKINAMIEHYSAQGIKFESINVGGGLGIDYDDPDSTPIPNFSSYFDTFRKNLKLSQGQSLHFELGRSIVAQCGSLITKVLYVKEGLKKKFVIVDAGMTDLIRPALYQAHHLIQNLTSTSSESEVYDVVGPICESSDCFGKDETLPKTSRGDLLALRSAGAYGEIMASQYNCRKLPLSIFG